MEMISIKPVEGRGWVVECSGTANAQLFVSGAKAEMSARDLAHRFAQAGTSSRITLYLRDGSVAAQFVTTH